MRKVSASLGPFACVLGCSDHGGREMVGLSGGPMRRAPTMPRPDTLDGALSRPIGGHSAT